MVTQKDIAERCGVSISLVSRVLSGTAEAIGVTSETARRIREIAVDMGYRPNESARILKGAPARTIGVVVYDFEDPFFGPIIGELQRLAHEQRFSLVLGGFESRQVWDLDVAALLKHQIDGLVIIGSGRDLEWLRPFGEKKRPMARIGSGPAVTGLHSYHIDDREGVRRIRGHLADGGHEHLAFVGADNPAHRHRCDLLLEELRRDDPGITRHALAFFSGARLSEAGYEAARRLLRTRPTPFPTALVASSDVVALGVLRALAEEGLRVPDDMSVTGYDDIPFARLFVPALTTIRQPVTRMARDAFEWIVNAQLNIGSGNLETVFSPELVVRESTRPIN